MSEKSAKAQRKEEKQAERAKGFKIDVRPYTVQIPDFDEKGTLKTKGGKPVMKDDDFDVQGSLCDILFNRELENKPQDAFKAHDLAVKIRAAKSYVILDKDEMAMVRRAYDALKGVGENMIEFLKRIKDAEEISLKEAEGEAED